MGLSDIFSSEKKILAFVGLGLIGAGVFADFITAIVWWSRIHPWLSHGTGDGKTVYSSLIACWVFALLCIIIIAVLLILAFFVKSIFEKISESSLLTIVCISIVGILSFVVAITAIIASSFALKNKTIHEYGESYNIKCYEYLYDPGVERWVDSQPEDELEDYYKWDSKIREKITKCVRWEYDEYEDYEYCEDREYTNYLCAEVGAPSLIFAIFQIIGIAIFIYVALPFIKGSGDAKSANENDEQ